MFSVDRAPNFRLYRTVTAADSGPYTDKNQGIQCSRYQKLLVQVVPRAGGSGGADVPVATILSWTEADGGKFIALDPAVTEGPPAAGTGFEMTVDVLGREIFVEITGGTVAQTDVYVAVFDDTHPT